MGLQDAKQSLITSEFPFQTFFPGATLRQVLFGSLHQIGLAYIVKDGFLMIDSRANITDLRVEETERKLDRVLETLKRLERLERTSTPEVLDARRGFDGPPCIPWRSG